MKKTKRALALILSAALLLLTGIVSLAEEAPEETNPGCLLTLVQPEHGTLKTEDNYESPKNGQFLIPPGTEVRVTAEADEGYGSEQLLLNGEPLKSDENGRAVFSMPAHDSTLQFTVTPADGDVPEGSGREEGALQDTPEKTETSPKTAARTAGISAKSSGETITSAYIKKGSEIPGGIDVIRWENGEWTSLDHWSEGILGTSSGETLFCADPTQNFKEGLTMTSHNALGYYSQDTIDTVCALLYYVDSCGCSDLTSDQKYMMKQAFLWTALNHTASWYTGGDYVEINYGNGLVCGCGYNVAGHYRDLYDGGIRWLEEHRDNFEASGEIFTNGENQPLSRWEYEYHPTGKAALLKLSSAPELTQGNSCYSLEGAEYGVYADSNCRQQVGTLTTDSSGNSGSVELDVGKYYIKEKKAPSGYAMDTEVYPVTVKEGETSSVKVQDIPLSVPVGVLLKKADSDTGNASPQGSASLAGAEFTVCFYGGSYSSDPGADGKKPLRTWVLRTGADGTAKFDAVSKVSGDSFYESGGSTVLPLGTLTIRETKAPSGYLPDSRLHVIRLAAQGNSAAVYNPPVISEEVIRGGVLAEKWDQETDKKSPQGSAVLEGARFEIISLNENPVVVEGKTYQNGDVVKTIMTDNSGTASTPSNLLPFGRYRIRETVPPEGYNHTGVLSREFAIREDGVTVNLNTSDTAIKNDIIRGDLELIKFAEPSDEEEDQMPPLKGIVFELTSNTTGKSFRITTDENGYASTEQLAVSSRGNLVFDTYTVHEKNTPEGLKPVADFEVTISEEGQTLYYILEDKKILSPIRLVKTDGTTGKTIPLSGAKFQLLDENKSPLAMTTWYPDKIVHNSFQTDENGAFILPEKLPAGVYYFRELDAPSGYLRGEDLKFQITQGRDWSEPLAVKYEDSPAMGRIRIMKTDSKTGDTLADAEFTITAAEDIVTGDGTVRAEKDEIVDTLTTDEKGNAQSCELYLGKYTVTETRQPSGYVLPEKGVEVELKYKDQDTPLVTEVLKLENIPTKLILEKVSSDTGEPLEGVTFAIWKDSEEYSGDPAGPESMNAEDVSRETYTTDADGQIVLSGLEPGVWCIQETEGIPGYSFDREVRKVEVTEDGKIGGVSSLTLTVENEKTKITQTSAAIADTGKKSGIAREETVIRDTVTMSGLQPGEEYLLHAQVMDTDTGEPLTDNEGKPVTAEKTFTAEASDMEIEIDIPLDASALAGRTVTVFDTLYIGESEAAAHRDISAKSQQITFPEHRLATTALGEDTGTHDIPASKDAVIIDTVSWEGLIPGLEYELQGVVMDKETGEPYLDDGEEIRVSERFIPEEADGTTEMRFQLNSTGLEGKDFVIFEFLYQDDVLTASHEDIRDKDQTVHVLASGEVKKEIPKTGDGTDPSVLAGLAGLTGLAAASAAGAFMVLRRSRGHRKPRRRKHS